MSNVSAFLYKLTRMILSTSLQDGSSAGDPEGVVLIQQAVHPAPVVCRMRQGNVASGLAGDEGTVGEVLAMLDIWTIPGVPVTDDPLTEDALHMVAHL